MKALFHGGLFHPLDRLEKGLPSPLNSSMKNSVGNFCTWICHSPVADDRQHRLNPNSHPYKEKASTGEINLSDIPEDDHPYDAMKDWNDRRPLNNNLTIPQHILAFHYATDTTWIPKEPQPTDQLGQVLRATGHPTHAKLFEGEAEDTFDTTRLQVLTAGIGNISIGQDCNNSKVDISPRTTADADVVLLVPMRNLNISLSFSPDIYPRSDLK
ncbi:hypothetical protein FF38_13486 [Lucilia cuprina]|uniref:Uncharacterized protein n=1 Tax=Lucilia cuprina TaxID=7375 RepID=A0A0L0CFV3_LUCCU|nr:hypothetical protein FF38_13486 [Lucilia cuprina]